MKVTDLRKLLPGIEIENDPFCIGYWMRWANLPRPERKGERQEGWDQADGEIAYEKSEGRLGTRRHAP